MAQSSGKLFADYFRLVSTKSYLETLSRSMGTPIDLLIESKVTGKNEDRGTWGHPKVALRFAQWCSDEFAVQVDYWIDELLTTGKVELAKPKASTAIAHYTHRVLELPKRIKCPEGNWTVIEESSFLLIEVEYMGYEINKFDLLDGSIGIHWERYRADVLMRSPLPKDAPYQLVGRGTYNVHSYPFAELGEFKKWLKQVYMKTHLLQYLKTKYGALAKV